MFLIDECQSFYARRSLRFMSLFSRLSGWFLTVLPGAGANNPGPSSTACEVNGDTPNVQVDKTEEGSTPTGFCLEVKHVDELFDPERRGWVSHDSTVPGRKGKDKKEKDKYNRFAFTVVRQFEKRSDPADFLFTTLLDIKSPQLKKACEDVIGNVRGISWTFTPLRVSSFRINSSPLKLIDY